MQNVKPVIGEFSLNLGDEIVEVLSVNTPMDVTDILREVKSALRLKLKQELDKAERHARQQFGGRRLPRVVAGSDLDSDIHYDVVLDTLWILVAQRKVRHVAAFDPPKFLRA